MQNSSSFFQGQPHFRNGFYAVYSSPFGVELKGRNLKKNNAKNYRFGFQGQEGDDQIKGDGNSVNYSFRMHDPRLGRFFAVDPLASKYPHNSTYAFSENDVICHVELEGLEKAPSGSNSSSTATGGSSAGDGPVRTLDPVKIKPKIPRLVRKEIVKKADQVPSNSPVVADNTKVTPLPVPAIYGPDEAFNFKYSFDKKFREVTDFQDQQTLHFQWLAKSSGSINMCYPEQYFMGTGIVRGGANLLNTGVKSIYSTMTTKTIFRAVCQEEVDDIVLNGLRINNGGYSTGKLFAPTANEAAKFGKNNFLFDGLPNTLVKVSVPNKLMKQATKFPADGMNALFFESQYLKYLKATPLNSSPVIR
jgi:RHS repeat-associated protein